MESNRLKLFVYTNPSQGLHLQKEDLRFSLQLQLCQVGYYWDWMIADELGNLVRGKTTNTCDYGANGRYMETRIDHDTHFAICKRRSYNSGDEHGTIGYHIAKAGCVSRLCCSQVLLCLKRFWQPPSRHSNSLSFQETAICVDTPKWLYFCADLTRLYDFWRWHVNWIWDGNTLLQNLHVYSVWDVRWMRPHSSLDTYGWGLRVLFSFMLLTARSTLKAHRTTRRTAFVRFALQ